MTARVGTPRRAGRADRALPGAVYLCVGVAHVYWGTVSAQAAALGSASTLGLLVGLQFAGFLVGVLAAPGLGRLLGVRVQVGASLVLFALALSTPAWVEVLPGLAVAGGTFGLAAGTLETQVGALALQSAGGARALTVLETFFGVGAVAFPLYLAVLGELVPWPVLIALVALGVLVLSAVWASGPPHAILASSPARESPDPAPDGRPARRLPSPSALVMLLFVLFYAGFETNFANFLPVVVGSEGGAARGVVAVSAFWSGITIGRLFATRVADALARLRTLAILAALLAAVLIVCSTVADGGVALLLAVLLAGLVAAGVFPGALALCVREGGIPTSRMTSYFVAAASAGGSLMALPVGWSLEAGGVRGALGLLAGFAGLLVLLTGVSGLVRRRP